MHYKQGLFLHPRSKCIAFIRKGIFACFVLNILQQENHMLFDKLVMCMVNMETQNTQFYASNKYLNMQKQRFNKICNLFPWFSNLNNYCVVLECFIRKRRRISWNFSGKFHFDSLLDKYSYNFFNFEMRDFRAKISNKGFRTKDAEKIHFIEIWQKLRVFTMQLNHLSLFFDFGELPFWKFLINTAVQGSWLANIILKIRRCESSE